MRRGERWTLLRIFVMGCQVAYFQARRQETKAHARPPLSVHLLNDADFPHKWAGHNLHLGPFFK